MAGASQNGSFSSNDGNRQSNNRNVSTIERWLSAVAGGALAAVSVRRGNMRKRAGVALLASAGHLIYRGVTGRDRIFAALGIDTSGRGTTAGKGITVEKSVTISRPREEVYAFWRNFENLPRFMDHLESVRVVDDRRSHWVAKAPAGTTVEWDAEITEDRPNELIAWRSLARADVANSGAVEFRAAAGDRGTEVKVRFEYNPPAGSLGAGIARLFGEEPSQQVDEDLRRFKNLMEAGEIPTTEGQASGRDS